MRLVTLRDGGGLETAALADGGRFVPIEAINRAAGKSWSSDCYTLLQTGEFDRLRDWYRAGGRKQLETLPGVEAEAVDFAPLYRHPRKIWGIGMNYAQKAVDLNSAPPEAEPICFMKPDTSLIGPGDAIVLPAASAEHVTSEAELGIVIGRACKDVSEADALEAVAGFTPTLDMTCQDIHARNPRFLQRSKVFDTFFSFGPELVTPDEIAELRGIAVETVLNGQVVHSGTVAHMVYSPALIVAYFSRMMTLLPGDIIMTGAPGSVPLRSGDRTECRMTGFRALVNPVVPQSVPTLLARG
ncbi:fumarylacetoacetate hydrolase family protein [Paenibacillus sp. IB182496]|uniref:Fumarylacetoacetate hydrolase family protein n=1 Tax=Paenibacillus sabuli TaxID=2772509 RepID=A0A927BQB0_9BACL|nr:fumarylacetoacetate hydrolase family protein [Paenibacillus sabuli]MBD2843981.1 fumarylacetoacetate hydrolase family protein [Paenibacillus sabuli]